MDYYGKPGEQAYIAHLNIVTKVWGRYKTDVNSGDINQVEAVGPSFLKKRKFSHPADELEKYLSQPLEDVSIHPLHWWKSQRGYVGLRRMARDILAVPATSAASERSFSQGNNNAFQQMPIKSQYNGGFKLFKKLEKGVLRISGGW